MARGISLFSVLGIRIRLDYTWFIVFILFAWSLAYGYFPANNPGFTPPTYLLMGAASSLMLFVCVLVHELSHSYVSNRLGLEIKGITLFIFGGVAEISKEPDDAATELKIAVAGPAASILLAVLFKALFLVLGAAEATSVAGAAAAEPASALSASLAVLDFLVYINIVLVIFNMIPGFPLDGGRVLRALWWRLSGNIVAATRAASRVGKGFALFLIILGFIQTLSGFLVQGLWAVLIGVFLQQAAEGSYRQLVVKLTLEGLKVKDVMTKGVVTVPSTVTLAEAVEEYFFSHRFAGFPVTTGGGRGGVVGFLTLGDVKKVDREKWAVTPVTEAMEPLGPGRVLAPDDTALHALTRMLEDNIGRYPVIEDGALVGILSRHDIMRAMEFKKELGG